MLNRQDLEEDFSAVTALEGGLFRCSDVLPKRTVYYYLRFGEKSTNQTDFLLVSDDLEDGAFATVVLSSVSTSPSRGTLTMVPLPDNPYGFSQLVLAPPRFHEYFKGRLDNKREHLVCCFPIHTCEFSGNESAHEFATLRREIVRPASWQRAIAPKIVMRFENPKTGSGTGTREVFAQSTQVKPPSASLIGGMSMRLIRWGV
ncbi:hypothetical protein, partial [Cupriavidus sp. CuC1]|uniref:hypothetical protein n=1 Tax=Cupriavidus sp. CuC1 TaxID=3373131 RepID=UPI0037CF0526